VASKDDLTKPRRLIFRSIKHEARYPQLYSTIQPA
jgi:hypothetical protein